MFVVWWTGRGFLSLLFLIGVFGAFGAAVTLSAGDVAFERWPWLWGVGLLLAALANWIGGTRLNRVPANPFFGSLRDRLTYRPRNRFLSMPMEVWSIPVAAFALFLIIKGLL
jgi:hypothetical protein